MRWFPQRMHSLVFQWYKFGCAAAMMAALILVGNLSGAEIHNAAKDGDLAKVKALVLADPAIVNAKDSTGSTPLHLAAAGGHKEVVQFLIDNKADVHAKNRSGETPMDVAMFHKDVAELLRTNGGAGDKKSTHDPTIFPAARDGNLAKVKLLVEDDPEEVFQRNVDQFTPLNQAAYGHADVVEYLLEHKADIEAKTCQNETPLMDAAYGGYLDVVKLLLEKGANVNAVNTNKLDADQVHGMTALHFAAEGAHPDVAEVLLAHKADVNAKDQYGQTPICHAAMGVWSKPEKDYEKVVQLLLDQGADINTANNAGDTPLLLAVRENRKAMVEFLLAKGADVTARNRKGETAVSIALNSGVKGREIATLLSQHGAGFK